MNLNHNRLILTPYSKWIATPQRNPFNDPTSCSHAISIPTSTLLVPPETRRKRSLSLSKIPVRTLNTLASCLSITPLLKTTVFSCTTDDILTDPVLRQAYDDHGHVGITYVKRSLHSTERDPNALYPTLVKLHQAGQSEQARLVLREAIQQIDVEQNDRAVHLTATLDFPCTLESTPFFGNRGNETSPELKEAHMSFSVSSTPPTPDHKWTVTAGGSSDVECGKGGASGQVSVGYTPVQGTQISADCDISDKFKVRTGGAPVSFHGCLLTFVCM